MKLTRQMQEIHKNCSPRQPRATLAVKKYQRSGNQTRSQKRDRQTDIIEIRYHLKKLGFKLKIHTVLYAIIYYSFIHPLI